MPVARVLDGKRRTSGPVPGACAVADDASAHAEATAITKILITCRRRWSAAWCTAMRLDSIAG
jgi:hypothetical protein